MNTEILKILDHILQTRIEQSRGDRSACVAWTSARDIIEYALNGDLEALRAYDYLELENEKEEKIF